MLKLYAKMGVLPRFSQILDRGGGSFTPSQPTDVHPKAQPQ